MKTNSNDRKSIWHGIWQKKYSSERLNDNLHVLAGFDALSKDEWSALVGTMLDKLEMPKTGSVLEVGCGVGAFLSELSTHYLLSGVDYSENAISTVNEFLDGDFKVGEAVNLPFEANKFDIVLCWSVFFYFEDLNYAEKVLMEMLRVSNPGATLFIGDINDIEKYDRYCSLRQSNTREDRKVCVDVKVDHLFYEKDFFVNFAKKNDLEIEIFDECSLDIEFYSNSAYRFSVVMRRK